MKLIWQIVKKDLRLMAWPVALWIVLSATTTAVFGALRLPAEPQRMFLPLGWAQQVQGLAVCGNLLLGFASAVLAGFLVQEDSSVGTTAFWQTRPIPAARMLAAKVVGAALLLVIAPAVALTVVWAAEGFSLREIGAAASEIMAWQTLIILPALAIGAATSNLGRFLFTALGALAVFGLSEFDFMHGWGKTRLDTQSDQSRMFMVLVVALTGAAVILVWRYMLRRSRPVLVLAMTAVAVMTTGGGWSLDLTGVFPWLGASEWIWKRPASAEENQVRAAWDKLVIRNGEAALTLTVSREKGDHIVFAPTRMQLVVPDPTRAGSARTMGYLIYDRGTRWGEAASLQLTGFSKDEGPFTWEIGFRGFPEAVEVLRREREALDGSRIKVVRMHPRVMWEVPLREGEEVRQGSSFTRIVELSSINGQRTVLLHERDARLALDDNILLSLNDRRRDDAVIDCFLVVNRAQGFAQAAGLEELGTAAMNSLMISARALRLPAGGGDGLSAAWEKGANLIKVRFERDGFFGCDVPGGPITVVEEGKP
jgi:hypothetical protein